MAERMSFAEVVAIAREENDHFTDKGLEALFDIFEHFYEGGFAVNHPQWSYQEIAVLLGVTWANLHNDVLKRNNG